MQRHKQLVSLAFQILHQILLTNKYVYNVNGGNGQDQMQLASKEGRCCYLKIGFILLSTISGLNIVRWSQY